MALNDIVFNRNKSGLGAPLLSKDHVSGIIFYNDALPSGFASSSRIKTVFSIEEAEDLGIVENSADHSVEWYHCREFFQKNPKGELYIGIYEEPDTPTTHDFAEVETLRDFANGEIRQMGVYYPLATISTGLLGALQSQVDESQTVHKPLNILASFDISAVADLTTLVDLRTLQDNNVSVTIGQDGGAKGKALFDSKAYSITDIGAKLGAISAANVNECIAWVEEFPMITDGFEFDEIAFANGDLYKNMSQTLVNSIDDKGYIFLVKHVGYAGSFNNDSYTAVATTNDLATIENNRTIDKAVRLVRAFVLPKLASPIYLNPDGTLSFDTVTLFKSLADRGLSQMESNGEISASKTIIDPSQDVLQTNTLNIAIEIVPVGVARSIVVNIGFKPKL